MDGINSYVFVRKVPGQADQYSVLTGTSTTPPPVPGLTVKYSVRTAVNGSAWAAEQSITYPKPTETKPTEPTEPTEPTKPTETVDPQAAPTLTVSGQTISWAEVGDVTTYVLAIKVPGQETKYTEVSGTSVTPTPVPGVTVHYGLRTAVNGSVWATRSRHLLSREDDSAAPAAPTAPAAPERTGKNAHATVGVIDVGRCRRGRLAIIVCH